MEWVALTDKLIKQMEIELVETKFMTHLTEHIYIVHLQ